jgi:hypothetical protein
MNSVRADFDGVQDETPATNPLSARRWDRLVLCLFLILSSLRSSGEGFSEAFDNANKLYEQGKFADAAAGFESLVRSGKISQAIYFNWGNALFKSGQIGRAIAAYELARRMSPRDPDLRANLQFARNQVQGPTLVPDKLARWTEKLSLNEWTWLAAGSFWCWLVILTLRQWRPALRIALWNHAIWLGLVTLVLCGCLSLAFYFNHLEPRVVVVVAETTGHQAPLDESPNAFTLHDGAEVLVLDQKNDWLQVRVDPRRIGWIHRDSTLSLQPSNSRFSQNTP